MRHANPVLRKGFSNVNEFDESNSMTLSGAVNKTYILMAILIVSAALSWKYMESPVVLGICAIGAFIVAMITTFSASSAPITAPIYAALEGVVVGVVSSLYEHLYHGIVFNAVVLTVGILLGLLFLYSSKIIKPTENFKLGIAAATMGICIVYIVDIILGFFGMQVPYLNDGGIVGICISLFVVVIAALNLVLDFDFIEQGANNGAPKYMEWYGAFGLLVTLVWLYFEILRLLAKLSRR